MEINSYLIEIGFIRSENDFCLYIIINNNYATYLLIYVDDIIICGPDNDFINYIVKQLIKKLG